DGLAAHELRVAPEAPVRREPVSHEPVAPEVPVAPVRLGPTKFVPQTVAPLATSRPRRGLPAKTIDARPVGDVGGRSIKPEGVRPALVAPAPERTSSSEWPPVETSTSTVTDQPSDARVDAPASSPAVVRELRDGRSAAAPSAPDGLSRREADTTE